MPRDMPMGAAPVCVVFGAGFSIAPTLLQSAWFHFHNHSPLPGRCLVGAGTHPGSGVPGVLTSAGLVDQPLQADYARVLP